MPEPIPFPRPAGPEPVPVPCPLPPTTVRAWEWVLAVWEVRPCYVCGKCGNCGHREPAVEFAELEAFATRMKATR